MAESWTPNYSGEATRAAPERRAHRRVKCALPAEIRPVGAGFPIQGETTDVSMGGCYVATMFPLASGTTIEFRAWVDGACIRCKGVIRTSDPGVGNGVQFLDLDAAAVAVLDAHLTKVEREGAASDSGLSGVIHSRTQ